MAVLKFKKGNRENFEKKEFSVIRMGFWIRVTVVKPDSVAATTFNSPRKSEICFETSISPKCGLHASLALASCVPPVSSIPVRRRNFRTLNFTMADVSCLAVVMCMLDFSSEQDVSFLLRRETACASITWFVTVL